MEKKSKFFDKKISLACLIVMAVAAVSVILLIFVPLISIPDSASTSASDDGTYCGWQIAIYYWGKRFQQGTYYFGFNAALMLAILFPLAALLVAALMWRKAGKIKRSVLLFVVSAFLLFCGIIFLCALDISYETASPEMKLIMFYAKEKGTGYDLTAYPIINFVICLLAALSLTGAGVTNIALKDKR